MSENPRDYTGADFEGTDRMTDHESDEPETMTPVELDELTAIEGGGGLLWIECFLRDFSCSE
jgi:hypothetical protein